MFFYYTPAFMSILAIVLLAVGSSTIIGVIFGLLIRKIPHQANDTIIGFAGGVMLAAAIIGLLAPAVNGADLTGAILSIAGTFIGAYFISILDRIIPHLHRLAGVNSTNDVNSNSKNKILLFTAAIAIHKIPEGLATGVSFGTENIGDILTVAGSISLQNIPEAIILVAPLFAIGVMTKRIIYISLSIAVISIISVLCGYFLVSIFSCVLPLLLSSAGGAMLYIISHEMIPETHSHGYEKQATFALIAGLLLVLILQKATSLIAN